MSTTTPPLREQLVRTMRDGGHVTYEEVADDVLHLFRGYAADELRRADAMLPSAPNWIRDFLRRRAAAVQVTR